MSVLRILRNVAVLVILAVAVLTVTPGSAMAKHGKTKPPVCLSLGAFCFGRTTPCCAGLYCQRYFCVRTFPY